MCLSSVLYTTFPEMSPSFLMNDSQQPSDAMMRANVARTNNLPDSFVPTAAKRSAEAAVPATAGDVIAWPQAVNSSGHPLPPPACCQLCQQPNLLRWEVHPGIVMWKCEACELFQYGPLPRPSSYRRAYHAGYERTRHKKIISSLVRLSYVRDLLPKRDEKIRALDIGCSVGASVEAAKRLGWHSIGVDVSQDAVDYCNRHGLRCFALHSEQLPLEPKSIDLITAWHVIEHVSDVRQTLLEWGRVLRKDGIIVLATPDASSPKVRRMGKAYKKFWAPEHTYTFTAKNLSRFASEAGFQIQPMPAQPNLAQLPWGIGFKEMLRRWNENLLHLSGSWKEFYLVLRKPQADLLPLPAATPTVARRASA